VKKVREDESKTEPMHLCSAGEIGDIFGVGRKTVVQWAARGAPILFVSGKYQANYKELWEWLKVEPKRCKHARNI